VAVVTQPLHLGGEEDLAHRAAAEEWDEVLVGVGPVRGQGRGLDVLGGQPDGLDVLGEGDLAPGVVVPGTLANDPRGVANFRESRERLKRLPCRSWLCCRPAARRV